MKITITKEISSELIADLMTTVVEGGSDYWMGRIRLSHPNRADLKAIVGPVYAYKELYEQFPDFEFEIETEDGDVLFTQEKVIRGFKLLHRDYPKIFAQITGDEPDFDANDADVWFQLCLFGELVYG